MNLTLSNVISFSQQIVVVEEVLDKVTYDPTKEGDKRLVGLTVSYRPFPLCSVNPSV
jgi:hypothetical protein